MRSVLFKGIALFGIALSLAAGFIYFTTRAEECSIPILSYYSLLQIGVFILLLAAGYFLVAYSESKEIAKARTTHGIKGLRGKINSSSALQNFLALVGVIGIYTLAYALYSDNLC